MYLSLQGKRGGSGGEIGGGVRLQMRTYLCTESTGRKKNEAEAKK